MTPQRSARLSDEAMNDLLIGLATPGSEAHIASCLVCRVQLEEFRSQMQIFNQTSAAWGEARSSGVVRDIRKERKRNTALSALGWALAASLLLVVGLLEWNHDRHRSRNYASAPVAVQQEDSEAQIAEDNELLRSVDLALSERDVSPISEYNLSDGPHPRLRARPELRNR
jgi:hypothetical protein